ncbi:hypothetical protein J2Y55_000206 [Bosea sp. BE125]|uniref:hypothetical protein n=1 Tax=Bosea sp. BE125 TaxID=2817909 RepID=UPI002857132A|nr:hypothetical protein [Bosea sp. BE125]MDR6869213.1 hypothetical protein [Bosea sp. BE125]
MAKNKLRNLLELAPIDRIRPLHEDAFTEMIQNSGGFRLDDILSVPPGVANADFIIPCDDGDILLELKQLSGESTRGSLARFFEGKRSRARYFEQLPGNITRINSDAMTPADWTAFHREFRPNLFDLIKKAARQLKESEELAQKQGRKIIAKGVWLLNSGDPDMSLDLLTRLTHVGVVGEWRRKLFRSLDFAVCSAWTQFENPHHTINALPENFGGFPKKAFFDMRPIYRSPDPAIITACQSICLSWMRYCAFAIDADIKQEFFRGEPVFKLEVRPSSPFAQGYAYRDAPERAMIPIELPTTAEPCDSKCGSTISGTEHHALPSSTKV